MSDQDDFELRLGAAVKVFATGADGPFDASQLAASALRTRNDGWLTRPFKRPAQGSHVPATAAIAVVFVAVASFAIALYAGRPSGNIAVPASTGTPFGSPSPSTSETPAAMQSSPPGYMWPQSTLDEVRQAQELADAGYYTGQVLDEAELSQHHPGDARFFPRFLEEVLGWEEFRNGHDVPLQANANADLNEGDFVVYIRCEPGGTNALYPGDPMGASCAPTIDELRYETVKITVAQLDGKGASGIWVVTGWEMIGPAVQADPRVDKAEATALLEDFLQARIDGNGAEEYVPDNAGVSEDRPDQEIPLLYATSAGAPYERSEFELVVGPAWPSGWMEFDVRLFAENDETVVEQRFWVYRDQAGRQRIAYDPGRATTENGKAVPVEYSLLDGEVTYRAAAPLMPSPLMPSTDEYRDVAIEDIVPDDFARLLMLADPTPFAPGCVEVEVPADADALARIIGSDPRFEATAPVRVTIGGVSALQMDMVLLPGAGTCSWSEGDISESGPLLKYARWELGQDRARFYLLDLPEGSKARVLALVTITDDDSFETVLEAVEPVLDSIEFHAP